MKKLVWVIGFLCFVMFLYLGAALVQRKPVLFHVLAETGCACGDYHERVTGLVVFNPFRSRLPERSAEQFLDSLRRGECTVEASLCGYALSGHRVSEWRLANAQKMGDRETLYYRLTKIDSTEARFRFTGEGVVEVAPTREAWTVVGYSSYF